MPVITTTAVNTIPRYNSSLAGSSSLMVRIPKAKKQSAAPTHNSIEKPPNSFVMNFNHSGVVLGGVRAFKPSLSSFWAALALVNPF